MKKWLAIILSIICAVNLLACSGEQTDSAFEQSGMIDEAEIEAMINVLVDSGTDYKNVDASGLLRDSKKYFASSGNDFCELYCGGHVLDANSQVTGVEFPNGIEFEGVGYGSCGVCMQQVGATHLPPILVVKGYSVCTYNNLNAFTNGVEVYHDSLFAYETVNGPLELGFLFAVNDRYQSVDFYANINQMNGACFIGKEADAEFTKEAIDFKVTYSKGLVYEDANGNVINRGEAQVVICAYGYEKNTGKVHYVQDLDEICVAGKTEDGKYFTVSYDSIYGYIRSLGLE